MNAKVFRLQRDSAEPMHRQLAERIAADIASGAVKPFERLPSEAELCERYKVSRVTVRQAIDSLVKNKIAIRKQGKGTFVAGPAILHDLQDFKGIIAKLRSLGVMPQTRLLEYGTAEASLRAREKFGGVRRLTRIRRLYSVNGAAFALGIAHLPLAASRLPVKVIEANPVYELLERHLDVRIVRADLSIRAQAAGSQLARTLEVSRTAPLLVCERTSFCAAGNPQEHTEFWARAENYAFGLSVRGPIPIRQNLKFAV